jgi:hypothetical protein
MLAAGGREKLGEPDRAGAGREGAAARDTGGDQKPSSGEQVHVRSPGIRD